MAYIYGHIHCAPMLLWLAEVAGVPKGQVRDADRALRALVHSGVPDSNPRCGWLFAQLFRGERWKLPSSKGDV
jgi:hypothetical protein